jgi:energy-converting hydrogenase A subunit M
MAFGLVVVFESLKRELLQELKELIVVLSHRYEANEFVELVNIMNIDARHELLDCAVDHSYHLCVLADLALPDKVNGFLWKGAKLGQELEDAAAPLDNFEVSVLTEDDIKDPLL